MNHPAVAPRDVAAAVPASEAGSGTGTVLVVEDEEMLRLAASKVLRRKGFSVIEAIDGSAAVELFRDHVPDIGVVLLDMTLPGMRGPEVLAELRRIQPDVRVIFTSAYSQEKVLAAVGPPDGLGFIRKPYRLNDLVNVVRAACSQRQVPAHNGEGRA